jgi:hypothetical protein
MDTLLLYVPMWCVMFNIQDHMFNRNMEVTQKKVLPLWLCPGLIIRELGVRYALPDKGWGLTVDGVWTCSGKMWAWLRHGTHPRALYAALIR